MNHNGKNYELIASCHGEDGNWWVHDLQIGDVIVTGTNKLTLRDIGYIWWASHDETYLFDSWQSESEVAFTEIDMIAILWSGVEIYRENKDRVLLLSYAGIDYYYNSEWDRVEYAKGILWTLAPGTVAWNEIVRLKKKCGELPQ